MASASLGQATRQESWQALPSILNCATSNLQRNAASHKLCKEYSPGPSGSCARAVKEEVEEEEEEEGEEEDKT